MGLHASVMEIVAEFHGTMFGQETGQAPAEVLGGLKILAAEYVAVNVGGGMGVLSGIGAPDWRVFSGVSVAPSFDPNRRDTDKDGIVDAMDQCIRDAEDIDGFQDEDGCPEIDNDADGLYDRQDRRPRARGRGWLPGLRWLPRSGQRQGWHPRCLDRRLNEAETNNGYQDEDGCPDSSRFLDTDGDGYNDDVDRCPYDAEDFDGEEDEDGRSTSAWSSRRTSSRSKRRSARVRQGRHSGAPVQPDRRDGGDHRGEPRLKKIRIEGHTDSVGSDMANKLPSQSRADSVADALSLAVSSALPRRRGLR